MTHDISPSSISFSFSRFLVFSFSRFLLLGRSASRRGGREERGEEGGTGDLFEILRSCRRCANSHMQTPKELAASIKINTGSVVGAKIKKDEPLLCLPTYAQPHSRIPKRDIVSFLNFGFYSHDDRYSFRCEGIALEFSIQGE